MSLFPDKEKQGDKHEKRMREKAQERQVRPERPVIPVREKKRSDSTGH